MEPMIYRNPVGSRKVLFRGDVNGIEAAIVSYGSHPCAYIRVTDELEKKIKEQDEYLNFANNGWPLYDLVLANPHGGFTFYGDLSFFDESETWVGWDYAHAGDYVFYGIEFDIYHKSEHRWTTEEIFEEVKEVVRELKENYGL